MKPGTRQFKTRGRLRTAQINSLDSMNTPQNRLLLLIIATLMMVGGGNAADQPRTSPIANATNQFKITGMHCGGCARGLESELNQARGVASASVSLTNTLAVVAYDTNRTNPAKLVKVVEAAGFKVEKASR